METRVYPQAPEDKTFYFRKNSPMYWQSSGGIIQTSRIDYFEQVAEKNVWNW